METKLKRSTYLSLLLFFMVVVIYLLPNVVNTDHYRKLLGQINLYLFYPLVLIALALSIRNLTVIFKSKNILMDKRKWVLLNIPILAFVLFFVISATLVINK